MIAMIIKYNQEEASRDRSGVDGGEKRESIAFFLPKLSRFFLADTWRGSNPLFGKRLG